MGLPPSNLRYIRTDLSAEFDTDQGFQRFRGAILRQEVEIPWDGAMVGKAPASRPVPGPTAMLGLACREHLETEIDRKVFRIVHLIYHAQPDQGTTKDPEFSRLNIDEHWRLGYLDATRTLRHVEALSRPDLDINEGVANFDVAVDGRL